MNATSSTPAAARARPGPHRTAEAAAPRRSARPAAGTGAADAPMRLAPRCACGGGCPHCVVRGTGSGSGLDTDTALAQVQQAGAPLPNRVRESFEPRFGIDLGAVRVHADGAAATAARAVQANAYTVGSHIVFGAGRFAPDTTGGQRLLAHELAHVVQQAAGGPPAIQREPEGAAPTSTPGTAPTPAADGTAAAKGDAKQAADAKPLVSDAAVKEAAKHPFITGLFSDIFKDLAYRKDFSLDEKNKLKLKGTESASYGALYSALLLPLGGTGGLQYGSDFGTNLSVFGKYLDAIEPLTPSLSIKTDLASRILGMRVDEYLGSDTFLKRLKDNAHTVAYLAMVAQMGVMTAAHSSPASPDAGGLVDETWNADLMLVKALIGLALKEKLKAPGIFDTGPLLTPTHPLYEKDTYFGGDLPSGLNIDAASGSKGQGDKLQLGATVNLGKLVGGGPELDDPRKYRGWQGAVWGDYQRLRPTPELADRGRLPDARFRAGGLLGAGGVFLLGEVGGHFSGADADQLTSVFYSEGLAFVPADGPVKKLGFKVTHINFEGGDSLAPAGTGPEGSGATRVTPFGSFQLGLGGGLLAFGGSAGLTTSDAKPLDLSDWRGDISYTYLGKEGTADLPKFRIELSGSGSRVDYFDPTSPMLYGGRGKLQVDRTFFGAQFNVGADKIPAGRAEQALDPHSASPLPQIAGDSVLFVIGVLR